MTAVKCEHAKVPVNDRLSQCARCGRLFTTVPKKVRPPRPEQPPIPTPEGYAHKKHLCSKYGLHPSVLSAWHKRGLISKAGRGLYYEKDVARWAADLGEQGKSAAMSRAKSVGVNLGRRGSLKCSPEMATALFRG